MSASRHPDLHDLSYIIASFWILVILVSSFRLYLRLTRKKWWWDDTFAMVGMIMMSFYVIGSWIMANTTKPRKLQIIGYYLLIPGFYIPIWSARLSILFTIIRITPWPRQRIILSWFAASFILVCIMLHLQILYTCEIQYPAWKKDGSAFCALGTAIPITQVITSFVSDVMLVSVPLWILRTVLVDQSLKRRLVSVFSVSVATTLASFGHAVLIVVDPGVMEAIFSGVEVTVAMTVCNTSVVVPFILQRLNKRVRDEVDFIEGSLSALQIADMSSTRTIASFGGGNDNSTSDNPSYSTRNSHTFRNS